MSHIPKPQGASFPTACACACMHTHLCALRHTQKYTHPTIPRSTRNHIRHLDEEHTYTQMPTCSHTQRIQTTHTHTHTFPQCGALAIPWPGLPQRPSPGTPVPGAARAPCGQAQATAEQVRNTSGSALFWARPLAPCPPRIGFSLIGCQAAGGRAPQAQLLPPRAWGRVGRAGAHLES